MSEEDMASAVPAPGLRPSGAEPASPSQAKPQVPDADFDMYALLSEKQWIYVCALLTLDLDRHKDGLRFIAPDDPDDDWDNEINVAFELEAPGMNWTGGRDGVRLSTAIIRDNPHFPDELLRAASSLQCTAERLVSHARGIETRHANTPKESTS